MTTDLISLRDRVMTLTVADREVDHRLLSLAGWKLELLPGSNAEYWTNGDGERTYFRGEAPNFTSSVDAILALIERELPTLGANVWSWPGGPHKATLGTREIDFAEYMAPVGSGEGPTMAIALCLAFLRAIQSEEASNG